MRHFFQRRRYQTGQADDIDLMFFRFMQYRICGHHHTQINHFIVIALQHHADNIFTNIVYITFDCRHQDFAITAADRIFFRLQVRHQMRHGLFHHARGLHHLWQEHLAFTKQITNDVHAIHQWTFYHMQWTFRLLPGFFRIFVNVIGDAFYQRMRKSFIHRFIAPCLVFLDVCCCAITHVTRCDLEQTISGIIRFIENDIFYGFPQFLRQIVIYGQLACINDAHIHARLDSVIEEHRVNRFTHRVVAAKRKRHIGYTPGHHCVR